MPHKNTHIFLFACRTTYIMEEDLGHQLKKHKSHAQGHLQRDQASVECEEAPYSHLARYLLEEFAFGGLSAN